MEYCDDRISLKLKVKQSMLVYLSRKRIPSDNWEKLFWLFWLYANHMNYLYISILEFQSETHKILMLGNFWISAFYKILSLFYWVVIKFFIIEAWTLKICYCCNISLAKLTQNIILLGVSEGLSISGCWVQSHRRSSLLNSGNW